MSTLIPRTLLFKVLFCVAINTGIGLVFVLLRWSPFFPSMVYAQAIGLSIFTLMTLGIRLFAPDAANHTHRPLLIMPFAVIGGLFFGYGAGDLILGYGQLRSIIGSPNSMGAILLFSLLVSGALTYFFTSRDRLSRAREEVAKSAAAAEAAQRHAAEAQLKLLETQLEPHMLFNTLANLRVLIGITRRARKTCWTT